MENIRFSIVIPTKERAETLRYCLKTCVEQEGFENYEIIVSDNNSSPATKEVVDSFRSNKLKYFSTGETLAMHDNFEFAISHARGEYIILLGDDDGILLKSLYRLDDIITKTRFKAIAWNWIFYYWPKGVPDGCENIMHIPISSDYEVVDGIKRIKEVIGYKMSYSALPMLYINAAIHRDLVTELKQRTGRVFKSVTPDCYSAFCMAYLCGNYLFLNRPFTIAGISGKSNGNNHLYKKWNNEVSNDYDFLNNNSSIKFHKQIPFIRSLNAIISEAFLQAKEGLFKNDTEINLNRRSIVLGSLKDLVIFEKEEWDYSIETIKRSLEDDDELLKWFNTIIPEYKPIITDIGKTLKAVTGIANDTFVVNGFSFNCNNVYDVASFYNTYLEREFQLPENVRFEDGPALRVVSKSIIGKIFWRIKLAGRAIVKGY